MTKEMIEITFGGAMSHARKLDECAEELTRIAKNRVGSIKGDTSVCWQGDSAQAYVAKLDETAANMLQTATKMRNSAKKIRDIADIFKKTELLALEAIQNSTY